MYHLILGINASAGPTSVASSASSQPGAVSSGTPAVEPQAALVRSREPPTVPSRLRHSHDGRHMPSCRTRCSCLVGRWRRTKTNKSILRFWPRLARPPCRGYRSSTELLSGCIHLVPLFESPWAFKSIFVHRRACIKRQTLTPSATRVQERLPSQNKNSLWSKIECTP